MTSKNERRRRKASRKALRKRSPDEIFGELRSMLNGDPSREAFDEIMRVTEFAWHEDHARVEQGWMPYIEGSLSRWPAEVCVIPLAERAELDALAKRPWAPLYRGLDFSRYGLKVTELAELVESETFGAFSAHIGYLNLSGGGLGQRGIRLLEKAIDLSALEVLCVSGIRQHPSTFAMLLDHVSEAPLRRLELAGCGLGAEHGEALARAGFIERLEALDLSDNALDALSVERLLEAATNLTKLGIQGNALDIGTIAIALEAGYLPGTFRSNSRLDLAGTSLSDEGLEAIAESELFEKIRRADLRDNALTTRGCHALASSPHARHVRALDVSGNEFGGFGLCALLEAEHLKGLRRLRANHCAISGLHLMRLDQHPPLTEIDLCANDAISDDDLRILFRWAGWDAIQTFRFDQFGSRYSARRGDIDWATQYKRLETRRNPNFI